jgi:5'-nucleotidase/UDP-sugar diphosphatase
MHLPHLMGSALVVAALVTACGPAPGEPDAGTVDAGDVVDDAGVPDTRQFTVLATGDEHGALLPEFGIGGAANVLGRWNATEQASPETHLIVSSGDMWMGPAISTWFEGEPTIEAMNRMGYSVATLGNHEFDLGQDVLAERQQQADFPFVGANILVGDPPENDARFPDYELFDVGGVSVAVIGLTNVRNPELVLPSSLEGLTFPGYRVTLEEVVPLARMEGAEVVIVAVHEGYDRLAEALPELDVSVDLWLLGHTHNMSVDTLHGAPAVAAASHWRAYSRTLIELDDEGLVTVSRPDLVEIYDGAPGAPTPDAELGAYIATAEEAIDAALGDVIGYLDAPLIRAQIDQGNWVTDAYRWAFPEANVALQQRGGLRDNILVGEVTRADIRDVFSFPNSIVLVELTAGELTAVLEGVVGDCPAEDPWCFPAVSGFLIDTTDGTALYWPDGTPIDDDEPLTLATNNYIYEEGTQFPFADYDDDATYTGAHYSAPAMDWTAAQRTTEDAPLFDLIDGRPRSGLAFLEAIGTSSTQLDHYDRRVTNLVADAFLAAAPSADMSFLVSLEMGHDLPAGPLTRGDAFALYPWMDLLVTVTMSLADVESLLSETWAACPLIAEEAYLPGTCWVQVGGVRWSETDGVVAVETLAGEALTGDIEIVTTDFHAMGGFNGVPLPGVPTPLQVRGYDAIADYIESLGSSEAMPLHTMLDDEPRGPEPSTHGD